MNRIRIVSTTFVLAVVIATAAQAQATRTWVSGVGDDANPCSRTAPCKTFAGAISKTAAGGEISVLDPGGFGSVTITKSITINGDGTLAGILNSLVNGVTINAGVNDRVVLRNLSINGGSNGLNGIRFLAGKQLVVSDCTIQGFTGIGIDISLTSASTRNVHVENTTINSNHATVPNSSKGIRVNNTGAVLVTLDNVTLTGLNNGIEVVNGRAMISNSVISNNLSNGILASAATAQVNVEGSQIAYNELVGVNASASGALIRLANNEIYNNTTGIAIAAGATVSSAGNNRVSGNGSSAAPNGTPVTLQ